MLVKKKVMQAGRHHLKFISLPKDISNKVSFGEIIYLDIKLIEIPKVSFKCTKCTHQQDFSPYDNIYCSKCNSDDMEALWSFGIDYKNFQELRNNQKMKGGRK